MNTFNCSENTLTRTGTSIKVKLPSVHVSRDFNFKDIDWPDRRNKSGVALSQSEGQMLIDIMNDHGLEQLVHFPPRKKYIGFITHFSSWSVSGYSRTGDKLRDHDIVAGTVKVVISPIKNLGKMSVYIRKMIINQRGKMHLNLQRKSISTVVQILARYKWTLTWLLLLFKIRWINTSPSKTSRTVSSVPWITSEIRRKIRRRKKN